MSEQYPTKVTDGGDVKIVRLPAEDPEAVRIRDRARDCDFPAADGTDPVRYLREPDE
jgi:hypothetical protein